MAEITGVLLAAGSSSRFGANKLLCEFRSHPLILHAVGALQPCSRVVAVVRESDADLIDLLRHRRIETVVNTNADLGMGRSIACGVAASAESDGWCLLPADMPQISSAVTRRIVESIDQGASLAAPFYRGRRGHPVGFGKSHQQTLLSLSGDIGARDILRRHAAQVQRIDCEAAGILFDVDTPQDLSSIAV